MADFDLIGTLRAITQAIIGHRDRIAPDGFRHTHLGFGRFAAAQVPAIAAAMRSQLTVVSMTNTDATDELSKQGNRYFVVARGPGDYLSISTLHAGNVLVAAQQPDDVVEALSASDLITLTVTPDGYNPDATTDRPDASTLLVHALARRGTIAPAPVVLPLDNARRGLNGEIAKASVLRALDLQQQALTETGTDVENLRRYLERDVVFTNSVIDRIVPDASDEMLAWWQARSGDADEKKRPIFTERAPDPWLLISPVRREHLYKESLLVLTRVEGAEVVTDITPFSIMKNRMVNGTHLAVGLLGSLFGTTYVHEALDNPYIKRTIEQFIAETAITIDGIDPALANQFGANIIRRLQNEAVPDTCARLVQKADGKLPRLTDPLSDFRHNTTAEPRGINTAIAAWSIYVGRPVPEQERAVADLTAALETRDTPATGAERTP